MEQTAKSRSNTPPWFQLFFLNRCATGNKDDPFSCLCRPESNFQRMT
ncbi:Uncharacterised protein [Vibrio cholerae]|nr:Uncharacterised protein [Vibrio cholerae]